MVVRHSFQQRADSWAERSLSRWHASLLMPVFLLFLSRSLSFVLLLHLLPKALHQLSLFLYIYMLVCFTYGNSVFFCLIWWSWADAGSNSNKPVKLREDWRKRSRPIPPGGTYPAKDHCRFFFFLKLKNLFLAQSKLVSVCLFFWLMVSVDAVSVTLTTLRMLRMLVLSLEMECPELK